jgi:hypothetical protein
VAGSPGRALATNVAIAILVADAAQSEQALPVCIVLWTVLQLTFLLVLGLFVRVGVLHARRAMPFSARSLMKSVSRATNASSIFRLNGGLVNCSRLRTNTLH